MVSIKKIDESAEEKILAAAKKVFISKGMAGARMQDIADEAGINKALLHYYFKNKEKLFETIFTEIAEKFFPQVNQIFNSDNPLFVKIEMFCASYVEKILENPYIPMFVLNEINQRPKLYTSRILKSGFPDIVKFIREIEAEVKAGKIRDIDPLQLIMNMVSMCIFPFVGKPMFMAVMRMDEPSFRRMMEARKTDVPRFIIESIKK